MKILFPYGLFYPSKLGGPANTYYWLAKALVAKGYQVTVVTTNKHIDDSSIVFDEWTEIDGIRILYCTDGGRLPVKMIKKAIKEIPDHDVLLLGSVRYLPNFINAFVALLKGKKIIWSVRGELFDTTLGKGISRLAKRSYVKLQKAIFAKRVIYHATSEEERELIVKRYGKHAKTVLIPNYMELPAKQERNAEEKYFLYAGRIARIKALDKLLTGLKQSELFLTSDYKLYLAGQNWKDFQQELEVIIDSDSRLQERVQFLGSMEKEKLYTLYANAHFLFLVSHSENFGNVVIEALSQGTPVVASKGTPWEVLEKQKAGYWIDNSPEEIRSVVEKILKMEKEDYMQTRNNAYELAKEFDIYTNIDNWIKVIQ